MREEVSEVGNLLIADRIEHIRHRGVVAAARVVLVFAHGFDEVVFALAGEPGNVLFAGKISLMTEITSVLLDERAGAPIRSWSIGPPTGLGGGNFARCAAMLRRSSSVSPCIAWFIGSKTRSLSRNMSNWIVR